MRSRLLMAFVVGALLALCAGGAAARNGDVEAPVAGTALDSPHRWA